MRHPITLNEVFRQEVEFSPVASETAEPVYPTPVQDLTNHVQPFVQPSEGLGAAWRELYHVYQGASAHPDLLRAVHDVMEAIEDAPRGAEFVAVPQGAAKTLKEMTEERGLIADYYRRCGDHEVSGALFMINHGFNLYDWGQKQQSAPVANIQRDFALMAAPAGGNVIHFPAGPQYNAVLAPAVA